MFILSKKLCLQSSTLLRCMSNVETRFTLPLVLTVLRLVKDALLGI